MKNPNAEILARVNKHFDGIKNANSRASICWHSSRAANMIKREFYICGGLYCTHSIGRELLAQNSVLLRAAFDRLYARGL
jgi:hypothetical protein